MQKRNIGILGASADPLHEAHVLAGLGALEHIHSLDEVWYMITPHNPLKDKAPSPVEHRLHMANLMLRQTGELGRQIKVSEFEVLLRRFDVENATAVMLEHFSEAYPGLQPVWLMGSDNLAQLHEWGDRWHEIMERYPVGIFTRPGEDHAFEEAPAAQRYRDWYVSKNQFDCTPGTWTMLDAVQHPARATNIRAQLAKGEAPSHISQEVADYIRKYNLFDAK